MYQIKLSPYAKTFYTEWVLYPNSYRYNVSYVQILHGKLDRSRLKKALIKYINGFLLLNSHIQEINAEPYWVKNNRIYELEYSDQPTSNSELLSYVTKPFDIFNGPLYRFKLVHISKDVYKIIVVLHHLIMDGASLDRGVFDAITNYYNDEHYSIGYSINDQIKLIADLTETLSLKVERNKTKYEKFWRKQLSEVESIDLNFLKLDRNREDETKGLFNPIEEIRFSYGHDDLAKLNQIKLKYSVTPYMFGQCVFALLLHRYTNLKKLAVSYAIAIKEGIDFIYGAQLNINLIPFKINHNTTAIDLLNQSREFFRVIKQEDTKYSYLPITDLYTNTNFDKRLLNVSFAQVPFRDKLFEFDGIKQIEVLSEFNVDSVPNNMILFEQEIKLRNDKLNYRVRFDKRTFNNELVNDFVITYRNIFSEVLEDLISNNGKKIISAYNLLDEVKYQKIVYEFNQTDKPYPKNKTIHQLFEEQVKKTPNNIAVVYQDKQLTYADLNAKANQLADYLLTNYSLKPDDLIVLCLDRSEYMLIGIFAILKAGCAYVPIDPAYPDARVKDILVDTNAKVILTNETLQDRLEALTKNPQQKVIAIDNKDFILSFSEQIKDNPKTEVVSTNLAYVIYTSGTTGAPKGVMVEHRSVVNYATYLIEHNNLNCNSVGSQFAGIGFDAVTIEIYPILISGGLLHIVTEPYKKDPTTVNNFFKAYHVTYAFLPTKFAELFFNLKNESLKNLIVGGERLEKFSPQIYNVTNAYGPTEVTVQSTSFLIDKQYKKIPIGKPINNIKCYIVDDDLNLLPICAVGELIIGGTGVARGYLNLPDLTSQKFISNPFQSEKEKTSGINARLYKTGDLARYLPDGNIEYVGRNDNQVKIRGYRIELGEIENRLLNYPKIKQAVVVAREKDQHKYLVAYYVADKKLDESKILHDLTAELPIYMLPTALIYLDQLPLTASGKVDKQKLPESKFTNNNYVAPKTALQSQIETLWAEVLNLPKESIGITNSFFKLGGDSILAIHLVSRLVKIEECKHIKVVDVFKYTTIEKLTQFIAKDESVKKIINQNQHQLETDIAIIAFSGAFSGCENSDEYWDLIQDGREGVKKYSLEECKKLGVSESILSNANFVPASGHVPNIDKFDAACWDLVPNEAKALDPQIRKFLEHSWYVLEASGYFNLRDKINIGVFAGSGKSSYLLNSSEDNKEFVLANDLNYLRAVDILATKTSYLLGLIGPALNINTACSTSLVTVIEACNHLAAGRCDMAIAGGVSLLMPEEVGHLYQEGMIYSKEEHCRVFDDKASGIIHGSGVGVVLLKRLSDAKRDRDNIIAVIKGYAINNDGNNKMSFTSPSIIGQKECIVNAQQMAKIISNAVDYVECHGTGTRLGDPIEIHALDEAFKYDIDQDKKTHKCVIGSVKANIGHADSAAGIAGLIKVCMMLEHKLIPKQINYDTPNKELYLSDTNFEIVTETKAWEKTDNQPRIAAVSSFGIGGTNAHAIISEYLAAKEGDDEEAIFAENLITYVLPITAKTQASLEAYKNDFIAYLEKAPANIKDISYTLQTKREHFNYRIAIAAKSPKDAIRKLKVETRINNVSRRIDDESNIIFMFPGQGSQYANMGLSLYQNDKSYKDIVDQCIQFANQNTDVKFESVLFPALYPQNKTIHDINQTEWAQPALFITQYSLAKLLDTVGVHATCYIGHSIGEYVAATLAGVFTLEDAIKLVVTRAKLMQTMPKGAMVAIQSDTKAVEAIIKKHKCEIAVINSEQNCVASGECINIEKLKASLAKENIVAVSLKVSHAFHSHFMDEAAKKLFITLNQVKFNLPHKPFVSNVTGDFIAPNEAINPEYWEKHLRSAVLFSKGINTLSEYYHDLIFIEVGAGKTLISFLNQHDYANASKIQLLNSFKEDQDGLPDLDSLEAVQGRLWMHGFKCDFNSDNVSMCKTVKLPPYHFDTVSYWLPRKIEAEDEFSSISQVAEKSKIDATSNYFGMKEKVVEKDLPDKYYAIAKVYLDVLGVEKISVNDDLAALGINSLMAVSLVAKLQKDYKISMDEFLKLQTIAKIAEFAPFVKNNLKLQLEKIKLLYAKKAKCLTLDVEDMMAKQAKYLLEVEKLTFKPHKKALQNILLTGATGHVGCNILYQLLHNTEHKIYLAIRAKSEEEAFVRVNNKFKYYFDLDLINFKNRIVILTIDLEKHNLGLALKQYQELATNLTSIIHSAALVKHYGTYEEAYKTNVQTTINLLELSKLTSNKDFHYISTLGVLVQDGYVPNRSYYVFHEDDDASIVMNRNNTYARTKYEAEEVVKKYRQFGITANIYRLGNVAMHSTNFRHQENIQDNAFFIIFKTILRLKMMYQEISQVEISPVDCTAEAIVKLFDQANLSNQTYHISNPHIFDLNKFFITENIFINTYSLNEFIGKILMHLENKQDQALRAQIELFMLHQKWLQEIDASNVTQIKILQDKTNVILQKLGFYWPKITQAMLSGMIRLSSTMEKKIVEKSKIFSELERLASLVPTTFYWTDENSVIIGVNQSGLKIVGDLSYDDIIGKSPFDLYPLETAKVLYDNVQKVIQTGKTHTFEESVEDITTGEVRYYSATRSPLFEDGKVVGTVGVTVEITAEKEAERLKIENERQKTKIEEQLKFKKLVDQTAQDTKSNLAVLLVIAQQCMGLTKKEVFATIEEFAVNVPISLYWFDENDALLGANQQDVELVGVTSATSYIGKTPYDFFPFEIADKVVKHNHLVMQTGKILSQEETIKNITTGESKYCLAFKVPLYSKDGKNIGILCTSVDITAEKNAERLKLENEQQKLQLEQAEKIRKITKQVVHDISSPIQSLRIMVENVKNIDEFNRVVIRNSTDRINDILNNLTAKYGAAGEIINESPNVVAPEIISCLVDGILSEKRMQYADYDITFELHIANDAQGLFAKVNSERFKRIMSNVINNAVEAIAKMQQKHGCINIHVYKDGNLLDIQIKDNGCGIPRSILEKIGVDQISTKTKGDHGIGLSSAIMQLKEWGGSYNIDSQEGVGVTFTIGLPIAPVPDWFLDKINFMPHSQIVILDDDESIHNVWEIRFKNYLDKITLHHFTSPTMLLKCLANLQTYEHILYLIDYELIGSKDSGVDVIKKLPTTKNVFLVTSRYEDQNVREACDKLKVKILPKNFAPYIPIKMESKSKDGAIDFVIIDDQECITMMWQAMADSHGVKIAGFNNIKDFEAVKDKLNKDTPIYIDRNLEGADGLEYSKELAAEGFTDIYLATADSKKTITIPTPWLKGVVDKRPPFI